MGNFNKLSVKQTTNWVFPSRWYCSAVVKPGGLQHAQLAQTLLTYYFLMLVKADNSHAESYHHSTATVLHIALKAQASSHVEEEGMGQGQGHSGASKSCPKGKLPNPDRMEKGNGGANTHWWVENRLQLCHKVIMAIKFCKNTKFLFGTFMKIQYLIFSPILGFLFLTGIKEKKEMYLVSYSPSIV